MVAVRSPRAVVSWLNVSCTFLSRSAVPMLETKNVSERGWGQSWSRRRA
jgi:hypothetical protein